MRKIQTAFALLILRAPTVLTAQTPVEITHTINSVALKDTRHIWVSLPPGYASNQRTFALTILLDGQDARLRDLASAASRADAVLDFLDPQMPQQIVVGIESKQRGLEFGDSAANTHRFIENEVLPFLKRTYRLNGLRTIIGHSLAGRFALREVCNGSHYYGIVAISPAISSVEDEASVQRCIMSDTTAEHAIYIATGKRAADRTEEGFRPHVMNLVASLEAEPNRNRRLAHEELLGYSHTRTTYLGIAAGLNFVFGDSFEPDDSIKKAVLSGKTDPVQAIETFSSDRGRALGATLTPPARWYMLAYYLYPAARHAEALGVIERAARLYPEDIGLQNALKALRR